MSRKSFGQLLQKYLRGECTPEEKTFVEHWYGLLEAETGESGQNIDMDELEARLWNHIQSNMETEEPTSPQRIRPLRSLIYRWAGIAAAVLLLGGWFFTQQLMEDTWSLNSLVTPTASDWIERTNTDAKSQLIRLEDGSEVRLEPHSSIKYPQRFSSDKRVVYLSGDAFFSVQKMPSRPFYVHVGEVVTKVLGTSFFIRTEAATQEVRVEVVTGRVAVYQQSKEKQTATNGVILNPNQAVTYFDEEKHFVTGLVEKPVILQTPEVDKQELTFRFDDAPLSEVLERLEQAYGIAIEVENEQQNNCPLTADLTGQPLYTQLEIICAALKSKYEVQGMTILISGKGCNE
ncbi:FecR family protein [Runella sp.]|uniref:FecR family protein n=1 Tax=Runella sp. TaxID=1960881 RepID=UPI003D117CA1